MSEEYAIKLIERSLALLPPDERVWVSGTVWEAGENHFVYGSPSWPNHHRCRVRLDEIVTAKVPLGLRDIDDVPVLSLAVMGFEKVAGQKFEPGARVEVLLEGNFYDQGLSVRLPRPA